VHSLEASDEQEGTIVLTKNETAYVDVQEAAKMLGASQRAVRNLVARGRLESIRDGEGVAVRLLVSVASVEKLHLEQ
jgi:excisionase family DNA binding protein